LSGPTAYADPLMLRTTLMALASTGARSGSAFLQAPSASCMRSRKTASERRAAFAVRDSPTVVWYGTDSESQSSPRRKAVMLSTTGCTPFKASATSGSSCRCRCAGTPRSASGIACPSRRLLGRSMDGSCWSDTCRRVCVATRGSDHRNASGRTGALCIRSNRSETIHSSASVPRYRGADALRRVATVTNHACRISADQLGSSAPASGPLAPGGGASAARSLVLTLRHFALESRHAPQPII